MKHLMIIAALLLLVLVLRSWVTQIGSLRSKKYNCWR